MPTGEGRGSRATQFRKQFTSIKTQFDASYIPEPNSGCWLWFTNCDQQGYGRFWLFGKLQLAHRISYHLHYGKTGLFVLHHCDNRCCVNPAHLYAGTQQDNMSDMMRRGRNSDRHGEKHHLVKLTAAQIIAIRNDPRKQSVIAAVYGVRQQQISRIKLLQRWGHI